MGTQRDPAAAAALANAIVQGWDNANGDAAGSQDLVNEITDRTREQQQQQGDGQ